VSNTNIRPQFGSLLSKHLVDLGYRYKESYRCAWVTQPQYHPSLTSAQFPTDLNIILSLATSASQILILKLQLERFKSTSVEARRSYTLLSGRVLESFAPTYDLPLGTPIIVLGSRCSQGYLCVKGSLR